jgi:hypothetical protein
MESNNLILEAVREADQEFPNCQVDAIVSIRTGATMLGSLSGGLINVVYHIISRVTNTEDK